MTLRKAAVAGQFYPASPEALGQLVDRYLDEAGAEGAPEPVAGVLVPHAGYPYSGPTAASAFARVRGKQVQRVVLLGRSHHFPFAGASIFAEGSFETPLGRLPVDEPFAQALAERLGNAGPQPHYPEHGLEVELPFLQVALGDVKIVPVLFGEPPCPWHIEAGQILAEMMAPEDLLVISTDLSHFLEESRANALDRQSLDAVLAQDTQAVMAGEHGGTCAMCGTSAVIAGMACTLTRGATHWRLLDYRTSARASGDPTRVVGYAAISMERAA
jgi:MEMO1 family protein